MTLPTLRQAAEAAGLAVDAAGVAVIALGLLWATGGFLRRLWRRRPRYRQYRQDIGRGILLGLEFLVAADIIRTVAVKPTLRGVAVLGLIVLIRTFLSVGLEVELQGRWPWQARERRDPR